jgi:hypothetical protein
MISASEEPDSVESSFLKWESESQNITDEPDHMITVTEAKGAYFDVEAGAESTAHVGWIACIGVSMLAFSALFAYLLYKEGAEYLGEAKNAVKNGAKTEGPNSQVALDQEQMTRPPEVTV